MWLTPHPSTNEECWVCIAWDLFDLYVQRTVLLSRGLPKLETKMVAVSGRAVFVISDFFLSCR